jgi:hypothetical protein
LLLQVDTLIGTVVVGFLQSNGGAGGNGGNSTLASSEGAAGGNGGDRGRIHLRVGTKHSYSDGTAGTAGLGIANGGGLTGGAGGTGGVNSVDL